MTLQTRLADLITAVGTDIKSLQSQITAVVSGSSGPWTYVVLGSDVVNSTVTAASVVATGTGLATGKYALEGKIWYTTAATTTDPAFTLTFPAQVTTAYSWQDAVSISSASGTISMVDNVAQSSQYLTKLDGIFIVSAAMASAISALIATKVASSAVTAKAGSFIRYRKIA